MDICPKCGLPKQACICEEIAKEEQRITVVGEKRKFGKVTTVISGVGKEANIKDVAKHLKEVLACGGTVKDGRIELMGNHIKKVKPILVKLGFKEDQIND